MTLPVTMADYTAYTREDLPNYAQVNYIAPLDSIASYVPPPQRAAAHHPSSTQQSYSISSQYAQSVFPLQSTSTARIHRDALSHTALVGHVHPGSGGLSIAPTLQTQQCAASEAKHFEQTSSANAVPSSPISSKPRQRQSRQAPSASSEDSLSHKSRSSDNLDHSTGHVGVNDIEPLLVNAKQYHRILKRRQARERLAQLHKLSTERKVSSRSEA